MTAADACDVASLWRHDSDAMTAMTRDHGDSAKLRAYEAVYWLNRSLEAALLSLERLERLGLFRLEYLNEFKIRIEHTRAEANEELTESLNQHEADDAARFDRMQQECEKRYRDPDDVFFQAQDRRQEIKDQIRELKKGLARQSRSKKARAGK